MSIATLKKKTGQLYHAQSTGYRNFSLNGVHRSQGWVGQTSLSRSLPRTLARGNTVRGNGGLNGTYIVHPSILSGLVDWNDTSVVKPSVGNSMEMLETRNKCLRRFDCPTKKKDINIVKKQSNNQKDYIERLSKCALAKFDTIEKDSIGNKSNIKPKICATLNSKYMNPHYTNINTKTLLCNTSKRASSVLESSEYILKKNDLCVKNLDKKYLLGGNSVGFNRCPLPGN
jgi:hypothetical protein